MKLLSYLLSSEGDFHPSLITVSIERFQNNTAVITGRKKCPEVENKDGNQKANSAGLAFASSELCSGPVLLLNNDEEHK